ncbi:MAG: SDR family oxidoreductase [Armatimonadetes bacterium]|nr:SDR family oxidoreductase [Armatimonadota bacterium]
MQPLDVFITGAGRGIGRAVAVASAARGGRIALNYYRDEAAAGEAAELTRQAGAAAVLLLQGDVASGDDVRRMADEIDARWGRLDVVCNNAGYGCPGKLEEITEEAWDRAFAVHVKGAFHVCRATLPLLRKSSCPVIINTGSVAGIRGLPKMIAYGTVKAALIQFTKCLAWELADENIRVNAVCPGIIRTDFHAAMTEEAKQHNLRNRIPLHREGTPEQIAQAVLALVDNDYITGEILVVDGGLTMRIC